MTRRDFCSAAAAGLTMSREAETAEPFPVQFAKASPYESLTRLVEPGLDGFNGEKEALTTEARLRRIFAGAEAAPPNLRNWAAQRANIRWSRFHVLPGNRVRFEISQKTPDGLTHRTGEWSLPDFDVIEEESIGSREPFFRDVTSFVFERCESFQKQLLVGNPAWRSRIDSAAGIDVDGNQGIAVADVDGDGIDEVYVCQAGGLPNRLYKFDATGRALDISHRAGLDVLDETTSALFADFRNMGVQDLVLLRRSGPTLFMNDGSGVFSPRPDAFRFRRPPAGAFTGMAAADYNRDGRLDLYLCTYVYVQGEDVYQYPIPYHDAQNGPPNFLFRNRAEGDRVVFEDVTEESGIDQNNNRFTFAAAWCDVDGDGWPDLYVANDFGRNNLYRNRNGRFTDDAAHAGVEDTGAGMGASWFDYDGDGRLDLYVSNMWSAAGQRVCNDPAFGPGTENRDAYRRMAKGNSLYRNRGDGTFEDVSRKEHVEIGRWAWGSGGYDFDLDGVPEIFVTAGMVSNRAAGIENNATDLESFFWRQVVARSAGSATPRPDYENGWNAIGQLFRENRDWNGHEPNVFYVRRKGRYVDASGVSGLDFAQDSRAFAVADFDGDGRPDIILKSRLAPQLRMLQNNCAGVRPALTLQLVGTDSNRDAIGARVTVNGSTQLLTAGSGFISQNTKRLFFGLAGRESANVEVVWPSGQVQRVQNLQPGFVWRLTEGRPGATRTALRARRTVAQAFITAQNNAGTDDAWLLEPVPDPGGNAGSVLVVLHAGSMGRAYGDAAVKAIDLTREAADTGAAYALLRRYLFEYREEFVLPFGLLVDDRQRVRKIYRSLPSGEALQADLKLLGQADPTRLRSLALPFPGTYLKEPSRNYLKLGVAFYWAGYPSRALPYLEEALHAAPGNRRAMLALGEIHRQGGEWDAAASSFRRALEIQPDDSSALVSLGMVLFAKDDRSEARQVFSRALEVDAHCAEAANQLGLMEVRAGNVEQARGWFERAIQIQPDHSGAINNLGVLFAQRGELRDSIAVFRYGLSKLPDDEPLHLNLARVFLMSGQKENAAGVLDQLLERHPNSRAGARMRAEILGR